MRPSIQLKNNEYVVIVPLKETDFWGGMVRSLLLPDSPTFSFPKPEILSLTKEINNKLCLFCSMFKRVEELYKYLVCLNKLSIVETKPCEKLVSYRIGIHELGRFGVYLKEKLEAKSCSFERLIIDCYNQNRGESNEARVCLVYFACKL